MADKLEKVRSERDPDIVKYDGYNFQAVMSAADRASEELRILAEVKEARLVEALNVLIGPARGNDGTPGTGRWNFDGCRLKVEGDRLFVSDIPSLQYGGDGFESIGDLLRKCPEVEVTAENSGAQGGVLLSFSIPLALANTAFPPLVLRAMRQMVVDLNAGGVAAAKVQEIGEQILAATVDVSTAGC